MRRENLTINQNGFYGAYYPNLKETCHATIIYMLGNSTTGGLVNMGVKWLHDLHCNVLVLAPEPQKQGFYDFELKQFGKAISYLKKHNQKKIGIAGGSATAMLTLLAASFYNDITLTIAFTPCDFVMEGYYRDGLDGAKERPSDHHSFAMYDGQPLPYLPFAYRHPMYWKMIKKESRKTHNRIATKELFAKSEEQCPLSDEQMIPVEKINGTLLFIGAKDDCLWDTCKYIKRMQTRILVNHATLDAKAFIYDYGTHFLFPQGMLKKGLHIFSGLPVLLFASGRKHYLTCKKNRIDVENKIVKEIENWLKDDK